LEGPREVRSGLRKEELPAWLGTDRFPPHPTAAEVWLDTIANVHIHGQTHQRPVDLVAQERSHLYPLNEKRYDVARTTTARASSQFRITLDANRYSAAYAHRRLTVKAYPDRVFSVGTGGGDRLPAGGNSSIAAHLSTASPNSKIGARTTSGLMKR
jgi:hypothetical protein